MTTPAAPDFDALVVAYPERAADIRMTQAAMRGFEALRDRMDLQLTRLDQLASLLERLVTVMEART